MKPSLRWMTRGLLLAAAVGCGQGQPAAKPFTAGAKQAVTSATAPSTASQTASAKQTSENETTSGWGDVTGRFVLDGAVPAAVTVAHTKDLEFCGPSSVAEELVAGKDGGIANVVVALFLTTGAAKPAIHPSLEKPPEKVVLDNVKCRFEPHICVVRAGQTLVLKNSDAVGHNVNANGLLANMPFNDLIAAGGSVEKKLELGEKRPSIVQCSIHPWMTGYLVVRDDPYVAVSGKDGAFTIKNLPAGKWTLQVWQEKSGFVQDVKVGGKATKWARGQVEVTVDGTKPLDLGEIRVNPQAFADK